MYEEKTRKFENTFKSVICWFYGNVFSEKRFWIDLDNTTRGVWKAV